MLAEGTNNAVPAVPGSHQFSREQRMQLITQAVRRFTERMIAVGKGGTQYEGARDVYSALGYKLDPAYFDFRFMYSRESLAKAAIDRLVGGTFHGGVGMRVKDEDEENNFNEVYLELDDRLDLSEAFEALDTLAMLGSYAGLVLGFDDVHNAKDLAKPPRGGARKLLYCSTVGEGALRIKRSVTNPGDARFTKPELYTVILEGEQTLANPGDFGFGASSGKSVDVHHERVIHVAYGALEGNRVKGIPFLEVLMNDLDNMIKIAGGSSEMFWRGARPGYQGIIDADYNMGPDMEKDMRDAIMTLEHDLSRVFVVEGMKLEALGQQVADPLGHFQMLLQRICAAAEIPQRILLGSERGELASSEDRNNWNARIDSRRGKVERSLVRPFIQRCVSYGVLPPPGDNGFEVVWSNLFAPSERQEAEISKIRSETLKNYLMSPGALDSVPLAIFLEKFMGFSKVEIERVETEIENARASENDDARGEEEASLNPGPQAPRV